MEENKIQEIAKEVIAPLEKVEEVITAPVKDAIKRARGLTEDDVKRIATSLFAEIIKDLVKAEISQLAIGAISGKKPGSLV